MLMFTGQQRNVKATVHETTAKTIEPVVAVL